MSTANLLERAKSVGIVLLVDGDNLRCRGPEEAISALAPELKAYKPELLAALRARNCTTFRWQPLDPQAIQEALEERIGILMANGMAEEQAVQEARWQLERSACWDRFHGHARVILQASNQARKALLDQYRRDAEAVFGKTTAGHMAATMRAWIARKL